MADLHPVFQKRKYMVKRSLIGLGTSSIYDEEGSNLLLFAKARFFKWNGFKLFTDKSETNELVYAKRESGKGQGQIGQKFSGLAKAFNLVYSVTDSKSNEALGGFQRKTLASIFRDEWAILNAGGQEVGRIQEKTGWGAFLSRITALIPQQFVFEINGKVVAELKGRVSLLTPKYQLEITDLTVDPRLILTGTALIAGIEGGQSASY